MSAGTGSARISRRRFLSGAAALAAIGALGGYAAYVEPRRLGIERITLRLPRLPDAFDGLTVVQLSDLHHGPYVDETEVGAAVDAANALQPDLTVITGDFVVAFQSDHYIGSVAAQVARLRAPLGVYGILGNHDGWGYGTLVETGIAAVGIPVLRNRAVPIERSGARLWLAGADDAITGRFDLEQTMKGVARGEAAILLAHEPDVADVAATYPIDLHLAGHSHGGQVRLPGAGPLLLPWLGEKYPMGHYRIGAMQLYVTRGVGVIAPPVRFNCPPELTHITLRRGA